jgi:hypothetical protein
MFQLTHQPAGWAGTYSRSWGLSPAGLDGLFADDQARQIVQALSPINHNADAPPRQSA